MISPIMISQNGGVHSNRECVLVFCSLPKLCISFSELKKVRPAILTQAIFLEKMAKSFGRDEMNALLGSSGQGEEAFRPTVTQVSIPSKKKMISREPDIASMTPAETAAMLMENNAPKLQQGTTSRYRTNRVLAHHELANELLEKEIQHDSKNEGYESEDSFVAKPKVETSRKVNAPQIISQQRRASFTKKDRRLFSSSSDDSDSDTDGARRRRSPDTSSDEEDDRRRERLIARKKIEEAKVVIPACSGTQTQDDLKSISRIQHPISSFKERESTSDSNSDSSSSSSDDSDSSSSDSSSDEGEQIRSKPVFVPKHRRNLIQSEDKKWQLEEERQKREEEREKNRKLESRAMLARQLAAVESIPEELNDESQGATNSMPDDADEDQQKTRKEDWEIREIERLLTVQSELENREKQRIEYERRRQMTDDQCLKEDLKAGRYNAPGKGRGDGESTFTGTQRFYHRGAYYMDEDEWDNEDVRFKAAEYATAATGEDKLNKKILPEIMQRKKFGFARQNTRYKGLKAEDTTDKSMDVLPLIQRDQTSK